MPVLQPEESKICNYCCFSRVKANLLRGFISAETKTFRSVNSAKLKDVVRSSITDYFSKKVATASTNHLVASIINLVLNRYSINFSSAIADDQAFIIAASRCAASFIDD